MPHRIGRRRVLAGAWKALGFLPALAVAGSALGPLTRFFRPTLGPYPVRPVPDAGRGGEATVAFLGELRAAWDFRYFTYTLRLPEYSASGDQLKEVPGAVVRLPDAAGERPEDRLMVVSRICPHLGCIFNFEPDPDRVRAHCHYDAATPHFCCPCHFSVYDPLQIQDGRRGRVVSGPAPRPPFGFQFRIEAGDVVVFGLEEGGTA